MLFHIDHNAIYNKTKKLQKKVIQFCIFALIHSAAYSAAYAHSYHSHIVDILVTALERSEDKSSLDISVNLNNNYDETVTLTTLAADITESIQVFKHNKETDTLEPVAIESIQIPPKTLLSLQAPEYRIELSGIPEASQNTSFINLYFNFGTEDMYSVSKYIP